MDLSHAEMLHPAFAGVFNASSKYKAGRVGNSVFSNWVATNTKNAAFLEYGPFPTKGKPIDQWVEMTWQPPSAMFLEVAATLTGEPRSAGYSLKSVHVLTPENERSTHYFWSGALRTEDQMPLDMFREGFNNAFEFEDKPMIEVVAERMGNNTDLLSLKPLLFRSDAGSVLARRVLVELIAKERGGEVVPHTAAAE